MFPHNSVCSPTLLYTEQEDPVTSSRKEFYSTEDSKQHHSASSLKREPADLSLLQHLWALSFREGLDTRSAGWNRAFLRTERWCSKISVYSICLSLAASASLPVADTGVDCTQPSAGKDPLLSLWRSSGWIYWWG